VRKLLWWRSNVATGVSYFPEDKRVAFSGTDAHSSATLVDVHYGSHFKVVTSKQSQEQYVLTQCGAPQAEVAEVDALVPLASNWTRKFFDIPLKTPLTTSTAALTFLETLGVEDRVLLAPLYATGACWQKAHTCNASLEDGWSGNATLRQSQLDAADVVFMDCTSARDGDCSNVVSRANAVQYSGANEGGLLASAEHIKFFALFFNKEIEAISAFEDTVAHFNAAAPTATSTKPVVAWVSYQQWPDRFVMADAAYRRSIVQAAGGVAADGSGFHQSVAGWTEVQAVAGVASSGKTYSLALSAFNNSENCPSACSSAQLKSLAAAAFQPVLQSADVLIDETYEPDPHNYNLDSFKATFETDDLKALTKLSVLRIDGTISADNGLDWYESRFARPEWAVEGLAFHLFPDSGNGKRYFRNLAQNETPVSIIPQMCSVNMVACTGGDPVTIAMLGPAVAAAGPTADDSSLASEARWAFFALAAMFHALL